MLSTIEADAIADSRFLSPLAWDRNAKGNLWRRYQGKLLTVFKRGNWFYFSINAGANKVRFGLRAYRTEGLALEALSETVLETREGRGKSGNDDKGTVKGIVTRPRVMAPPTLKKGVSSPR